MSVASSETLSDSHETQEFSNFPFEILEPVLARAIGRSIYEWVISTTFHHNALPMNEETFGKFWVPMVDLLTVSSSFRGIVMSLLCKAFGVRPHLQAYHAVGRDSSPPIPRQIYTRMKSLLLFGRAIMGGAVSEPPPFAMTGAPLLEAYGYYIIAKKRIDRDGYPLDIHSRGWRSDLASTFKHNCRCVAGLEMVEDLEEAFEVLEAAHPELLN